MSEIKLTADSGGGTVSFKGPATTTGNAAVPFVLPVADGSAGQFIKTDGSKNLSFATVAAPSGTLVSVNEDSTTSETSTTTTNTWTDTDVSKAVTPAAAANKFLVFWNCHVRLQLDGSDVQGFGKVRLIRDSTALNEAHMNVVNGGSGSGSGAIVGLSNTIWDHPNTTSEVTYKLQFYLNSQQSGNTMIFNWDAWGFSAPGSKLTIVEFKQ